MNKLNNEIEDLLGELTGHCCAGMGCESSSRVYGKEKVAQAITERELMIIGQLGSYSKPNLYKFLRKYLHNATNAMEMANMLDMWHRSCIEVVDKQPDHTKLPQSGKEKK